METFSGNWTGAVVVISAEQIYKSEYHLIAKESQHLRLDDPSKERDIILDTRGLYVPKEGDVIELYIYARKIRRGIIEIVEHEQAGLRINGIINFQDSDEKIEKDHEMFSGKWWEKDTLTKVTKYEDGDYEMGFGGGGFILSAKHSVEPKVGDVIELYGNGIGRPIDGVRINGNIVFQNSDRQTENDRLEWLAKNVKEKRQKFEDNKTEMDKTYEGLIPEFKARIDRFRAKNRQFRMDGEAYELFVCTEAMKLLKAFKTTEELNKFYDMDSKAQKKAVPDMDFGSHSGNTFGTAVTLARMFIQAPKMTKFMHGALAALTGCEKYGCHPLTSEESKELDALVKEYGLKKTP
jgi:hypothetical protein